MNRYRPFIRADLGNGIGVLYGVTLITDRYDPMRGLKNPKRTANRKLKQRRARTGRRK